jgi:rhodanese-related sulfurtransferase
VEKKLFYNISPAVVAVIIILSSATALVYNYFNPEGLTIISMPENEEAEIVPGEVKFFQPIQVNSEDAFTLFDNRVRFVDVRSSGEYKKGHIPESINLSPEFLDDTGNVLSSVEENAPLVVYGGSNSDEEIKLISERLFNEGFNRIYIYNEGFEDWVKNNYPVTQ